MAINPWPMQAAPLSPHSHALCVVHAALQIA